MKWKIDADRPVYVQIVEQIKKQIVSGVYQSGDQMPSVRELAADASVNPNTMQKSLAELERLGLVYSKRTSGRFITEDEAMIKDLKAELVAVLIDNFIGSMAEIGFDKAETLKLFKAEMEEKL